MIGSWSDDDGELRINMARARHPKKDVEAALVKIELPNSRKQD
jgi:hypothetical protein